MTLPLFAIDAGVGVLGGIAISLASIGLVFLIHELGHLLAAKACGMKISRYYLGFDAATDPRSFAAKAVWQRGVVIAAMNRQAKSWGIISRRSSRRTSPSH